MRFLSVADRLVYYERRIEDFGKPKNATDAGTRVPVLSDAWDWITYYPNHFDSNHGRDLLDAYPDYPVYATIFFLWVVFYLPGYLERHDIRLNVRCISAAWNLFLSLVSIYGTYQLSASLLLVFYFRSFHNLMCELPVSDGIHENLVSRRAAVVHAHQEELMRRGVTFKWQRTPVDYQLRTIAPFYDGPTTFSIAMFGYLKTPELLDTLLLVLQRKPVSFLHWYHHIVTAVYVWIFSYQPVPPGIFFCAMNYFVHSIMYFYYFLVMMGLRKSIRPFAPAITLLQVLQMFFGTSITVYMYFQYWLGPEFSGTLFYHVFELVLSGFHYLACQAKSVLTTGAMASQVPAYDMSDRFWGCDSDPTNMRMAMMMYGSYCVLFAVLFKELYLDKRVHKYSLVRMRSAEKVALREKEAKPRKLTAPLPLTREATNSKGGARTGRGVRGVAQAHPPTTSFFFPFSRVFVVVVSESLFFFSVRVSAHAGDCGGPSPSPSPAPA